MNVVLVRESDRLFLKLLRQLDPVEWRLEVATGKADFDRKVQTSRPDVIVVEADDEDGAACVQTASTSPAIVIACSEDPSDRVRIRLLELGVDAILESPPSFDLLQAYLRAAVKGQQKRHPAEKDQYSFENLTVDLQEPLITVDGKTLHVTATEYRLIRTLAENPGRILSHNQLLRATWGEEYEGNSDLVRTFVSSLRKHLKDAGVTGELIRTERSLGYWVPGPSPQVEKIDTAQGIRKSRSSIEEARAQRARLRAAMQNLYGSIEKLHAAGRKNIPEDGAPPAIRQR